MICMKRFHLVEIHDQGWCPRTVRDAQTDYLQFTIASTKPYTAILPILATTLQRTEARHILDLCSGAAGPWLWLHSVLAERGVNVSVCLTDKLPNVEGFDGLVSCPRTYSVQELRELTTRLDSHDYRWDIGAIKGNASPIPVTYLDCFTIEPSAGSGNLRPIVDSRFCPQEWRVRADATHGKSKTYRRTVWLASRAEGKLKIDVNAA